MEEEKISWTNGGFIRQLIATLTANLSTFTYGVMISWPSPVIKKLSFSNYEISWIASLMPLGIALTPWLAGPLAHKLGLKATLLLNDVPLLVGWAMIVAGQYSLPLLYVSRFMLGFSAGVVLMVVPIYVAEISTPSIRGTMGTMFSVLLSMGNLMVYSTGPYMGYREFGILCACPSVLHLLLFFWMPASPYHKMRKGDEEGAERALRALRTKGQDIQQEITYIREDVERWNERSKLRFRVILMQRGNLKALFMACGLTVAVQVSGINAVKFYTESIFDIDSTNLSSSVSAIIVSVIMVLSTLTAPFIVDKQGRRPALLISTSFTCITNFTLGLYFLFSSLKYDLKYFRWVPLTSMIIYIIAFSLGLGPVTWTMVGELFSHEIKRVGAPIASTVSGLFSFGTTKCFLLVVEAWGPHTAFFIFSAFCATSALFVLFILRYIPSNYGLLFHSKLNSHVLAKTTTATVMT